MNVCTESLVSINSPVDTVHCHGIVALFEIAGLGLISYWNIRSSKLLFVSVMSYRKGCINWLSTHLCLQKGPCTCVWVLVSGRM